MKYVKLLGILLIICLASCKSAKVPFTYEIQKQYNFSEKTLKKIQFYTSEEIVLYRIEQEDDFSVKQGKLIVLNEKDCEKIIIKKNTPCILERIVEPNKFLFSFEVGENKFLAFGNANGGSYSLLAKEWENKVGKIDYANKMYATNNGDVYLNVFLKKLNKLKGKERTVKGRKV